MKTTLPFKPVTLGCISAGVDKFQNNGNREILCCTPQAAELEGTLPH